MPGAADPDPFVIIGSGMCGGVAAKTLREEGYGGRLVLIGHEPSLPFGRPPLSKTYLRSEEELTGWLVKPLDWYKDNQVELVQDTATRIDTAARRVELNSGQAIPYEKLLVATGGHNRHLDVPGADLTGVFQLRTVAECDAIKDAAKRGGRAVVVGMGFIGSEVAASLKQLGLEVSAVLPGPAPLDSVLGPEMGALMAAIHRDAGVELIDHDEIVRFEGAERIERAVTKRGRKLDCDLAVVAIGIEPTVDILRGTSVEVENGVLVDATCRTNVPEIFAAGDVANHLHPLFGRIRVEHYNNAEKHAAAAARSMLGSRSEYAYIHSFWSDQYEHKLEYVGHVRKWDQFVVRGSLDDRQLVGFYLQAGQLRAAVGLNRGGDPELDEEGELAKAGRLIAKGARPQTQDLEDQDKDLANL
jgi:3-phenylpropionate/trans-cinnamate dioxygenase ferredoxin reductase component